MLANSLILNQSVILQPLQKEIIIIIVINIKEPVAEIKLIINL